MKNRTLIGLLTTYLAPFHAYELASQYGLELIVFRGADISWTRQQTTGLVWNGFEWNMETRPLPGAVYNRHYGHTPSVVRRLENMIGKGKVFNHITHFDKLDVQQRLQQQSLSKHLPVTKPYQASSFMSFLSKYKHLILKPVKGRFGSKVYRIEHNAGHYNIYHKTKYPVFSFPHHELLLAKLESLVDSNFIMQEYIECAKVGGRIFDTRLLVQKNGEGKWTVTAAFCRIAFKYSYVTNLVHEIIPLQEGIEQSEVADQINISELYQISINVATKLEKGFKSLGEISVDFGIDENGHPWIIEVNGKPAKDLFAALDDPTLMEQVYATPLLYAKYLATTSKL